MNHKITLQTYQQHKHKYESHAETETATIIIIKFIDEKCNWKLHCTRVIKVKKKNHDADYC